MKDFDIHKITKMLPHRYPFLLIDKVINVISSESGIGIKNVTINEPFFQGHFPNNPIMPGVLIVEAMAQTAAIVVLSEMEETEKTVYFMSIDSAKFRKPVIPGDQLHIHVQKERNRENIWKFSAIVKVNENIVAEANFTAMMGHKS